MYKYLPWLLLTLGIAARILVPWLIARRDNPSLSWQWRYIWPQLISFVVIALMLPVLISNLDTVTNLELQSAFLIGWAAADIGNTGRKFIEGANRA